MSRKGKSNSTIGELIKQKRERTTLSQEELAHKVGSGQQYISDLERGLTNPTLLLIVDICIVLEIKPSELVREYEDEALPDLIRLKKIKDEKE